MRKTTLLPGLLLLCAISAMGQDKAGSYLRCTLNGRPFATTEPDGLHSSTRLVDEKSPPYMLTEAFTNMGGDTIYSVVFYLPLNGRLKTGRYPLAGTYDPKKELPYGYVSIEDAKSGGGAFFTTGQAAEGAIEITSVADGWAEGTFSVSEPDNAGSSKHVLTDGRFRFEVYTLEQPEPAGKDKKKP